MTTATTTATHTPTAAARLLTRAAFAGSTGRTDAVPPVRIVHIGLGAFHRAHQAWYTAQAADAGEWGIAAFTGRSSTAADDLAPQGGLYTLIQRSAGGDVVSVVPSIVEVADGRDLTRFVDLIAAATTAIVTLTVTEAGYRLTADARPNLDDGAVARDIQWLTEHLGAEVPTRLEDGPTTPIGRLVLGLHARRLSGAGGIAIVPCDNMPGNGDVVRTGLIALATLVDAATAAWIDANVSFVSTSVDRITPRTTPRDIETASSLSGWIDAAPVVTEPFRDWVLSGRFPAGRPAWESAGARFVDDIEPFERRKLWLLNGAHSLLAYAGRLRGHLTVAAAIADPICLDLVTEYWDAAERHLPAGLDLADYRSSLLERFANARIEHTLAQIGQDGVTKLRVRFVPVLLAERSAGRDGASAVLAIGSWLRLVNSGAELPDSSSPQIAEALAGDEPSEALVRLVDERLTSDQELLADILAVAASRDSHTELASARPTA